MVIRSGFRYRFALRSDQFVLNWFKKLGVLRVNAVAVRGGVPLPVLANFMGQILVACGDHP